MIAEKGRLEEFDLQTILSTFARHALTRDSIPSELRIIELYQLLNLFKSLQFTKSENAMNVGESQLLGL